MDSATAQKLALDLMVEFDGSLTQFQLDVPLRQQQSRFGAAATTSTKIVKPLTLLNTRGWT